MIVDLRAYLSVLTARPYSYACAMLSLLDTLVVKNLCVRRVSFIE